MEFEELSILSATRSEFALRSESTEGFMASRLIAMGHALVDTVLGLVKTVVATHSAGLADFKR